MPDTCPPALVNGDDIWIHDIERDTMTRLTTEGSNAQPIWSPDGQWVAFSSNRGGGSRDLFRKRADFSGPAEALLTKRDTQYPRLTKRHAQLPRSWSPNRSLLVYLDRDSAGKLDMWALPLEGEREPRVILETPFWESDAALSLDGRWLAYQSQDSGPGARIYVQPFPDGGGKWPISTGSGRSPIWSASGRELFFQIDQEVMVVEVETEPEFQAGTPRLLFEGSHLSGSHYDIAPDGQRFLMILPEEGSAPAQLHVVLDWFEELKRLVPTD